MKSDVEDGLKNTTLDALSVAVERLPKTFTEDLETLKGVAELIFAYMITCNEEADDEWLSPPEGN